MELFFFLFLFHTVTNLPHMNLIFSISHPHTLFPLGDGEDGESRSVPSRREDGENRKLGASLKTNCNKVWLCHKSVEIGPGRWDYLLRSAPTYRERFVTSEKVKQCLVFSFCLLFLLVAFREGLAIFAPPPLMLNCYFSDFLWEDCVPCGGFVSAEVE